MVCVVERFCAYTCQSSEKIQANTITMAAAKPDVAETRQTVHGKVVESGGTNATGDWSKFRPRCAKGVAT